MANITLSAGKISQILEAGRRQLSPEEFEELTSLLFDLEIYGFTPWINARLGTLMAKIQWELDVGESPEWSAALQACDYAFLGRELKDMCYEVGASPVGHKKELCARLYRHKVPEVVAVMEPHLTETEPSREEKRKDWDEKRKKEKDALDRMAMERFGKPYEELSEMAKGLMYAAAVWKGLMPQTEPLWASKIDKAKGRLERIYRGDPDEFYCRKKLIEKAIKEREKGKEELMPELTLEELRGLLKFTACLYR